MQINRHHSPILNRTFCSSWRGRKTRTSWTEQFSFFVLLAHSVDYCSNPPVVLVLRCSLSKLSTLYTGAESRSLRKTYFWSYFVIDTLARTVNSVVGHMVTNKQANTHTHTHTYIHTHAHRQIPIELTPLQHTDLITTKTAVSWWWN